MSYRIEKGEGLADAFARIAAEEIDLAMAELRRRDHGEAVHNARKALKRLRALLRSLRVAFPDKWFRAENQRIAAAGRKISPLRDMHVQLRTLADLGPASSAGKRVSRLLRRRQIAFSRGIPALRNTVRQMLRVSSQNIAARPANKPTPRHLADGLKRIYRQGRDAFNTACKRPSPENLHEWRKKAKLLGYGFALIEGLGLHKTSRMIKCAAGLSEALGDDHDLFMVETALDRENRSRPAPDYRSLSKRISARRAKLQKRAFKRGALIYAEKPGRFRKQLDRCLRETGKTR
ncbi:MAG TPA: CHAD domain-containing protein [Candidatus Saccharimonadales bacterium]|nr:CHAD domain-containing protein [Candidatus Saccharimonadales bacterium]